MRNLGHDLTDDEFKSGTRTSRQQEPNFEIDFCGALPPMGKCEDGQFNVGTSVLQGAFKGSLGLEKIKKQVDELVREATDQHGRKLGYKNLPQGVWFDAARDEALFRPSRSDVLGRDFSWNAVRGPPTTTEDFGRPLLPRVAHGGRLARRVIHLNSAVAPSARPSCRNY